MFSYIVLRIEGGRNWEQDSCMAMDTPRAAFEMERVATAYDSATPQGCISHSSRGGACAVPDYIPRSRRGMVVSPLIIFERLLHRRTLRACLSPACPGRCPGMGSFGCARSWRPGSCPPRRARQSRLQSNLHTNTSRPFQQKPAHHNGATNER